MKIRIKKLDRIGLNYKQMKESIILTLKIILKNISVENNACFFEILKYIHSLKITQLEKVHFIKLDELKTT